MMIVRVADFELLFEIIKFYRESYSTIVMPQH